MRIASGFTTNTSNLASSTVAPEQVLPGFGVQTITVALLGIAGALFVFAALNALGRAATVKVRKR